MAKVIAVVSGKGGTGKTTVAKELAVSFARTNRSVLAVDMCFGRRNLDLSLNILNSVVFDISDVISKTTNIENAFIKSDTYKTLQYIGVPNDFRKNLDLNAVISLLDGIKERFDYIILDLPDDIGYTTYVAGHFADLVIGVTIPELNALVECKKTTDEIFNNYNKPCRIIVNIARPELFLKNRIENVDSIIDFIKLPLLAVLPYVESEKSSNMFTSIFDAAAKRINGEYVPIILKNI